MSIHEVNSATEVGSGFDSTLGLPGSHSNQNRDIFGQSLSKAPTALGASAHPLQKNEVDYDSDANQIDQLTGLSSQKNTSIGVYGDEFESGIPPIDYAAHLAGKALDTVDKAVGKAIESTTPLVGKAIQQAVAQISEVAQDSIETARKNWNAPGNEVRHQLNQRIDQTIGFAKQKIADFSANPTVREALDATTHLGQTLVEKTENLIQTAQSTTEAWVDTAFGSSYIDRSLTAEPTQQSEHYGSSGLPFVGVIDTNFEARSHGAQVVDAINQSSQRFPDWLESSIGTGKWAESLVKFVDTAKSAGRSGAIVNLSFDLTEMNPDGSVTTRFELTPAEHEALAYAQENGVLIVAAAGNQDGAISALGQASQKFNNIITVGASEGRQRADYSSYGQGLTLVAPGEGNEETSGTSLSAAKVTAAASKVWQANPQLEYRQVIDALTSTAIDIEQPGWDDESGAGQLNASAAVDEAEEAIAQPKFISNTLFPDGESQTYPSHLVGLSVEDARIDQAIATERPALFELTKNSKKFDMQTSSPTQATGLLKYEEGMPMMSGEHVESWQSFLEGQGYSIQVDGVFGSHTAEMTRLFQASKDIAADGIVGANTLAVAEAEGFTSAKHSGMMDKQQTSSATFSDQLLRYEPGAPLTYNPAVEQWQQRMNDRGWNITVDGPYGAQSAAVASQFQQEKGLAVDGIVGSQTWAATFDTTNVTGSFSPESSFIPALSGTSANNAGQALIDVAQSYIGVREQGYNSGAQVEAFQRAVDGVAQNEAWCMSFAQYCIKAVEKAAQADSPIAQSEHCLTVWKNSPDNLKSSAPKPGSLVIWQHGNSSSGHVGIVESVNADGTFTTIEGNTNDGSGVTREGIGVFRRQRDLNGSGEMRVVGFLNVFPDSQLSPSIASIKPSAEKPSNLGPALASDLSSTGELLKYEAGSPMQGDHVRTWQELLNKQGYGIQVDGVFGAKTDAATREFQRSQNLAADGIVGPNTQEAARNVGSSSNQAESLSLIPGIGDVFNTPTEPANFNSATSTPTISSLLDEDATQRFLDENVTLKRYSENGSLQAIDPNQETVVVVHGWKGSDQDENIQEIAREASRQGVQVLTLDWGSIAKAGLDSSDFLPPKNTAEWIAPVGEWAHDQLQRRGFYPDKLTLVGHSLGTYVSAELAARFGDDKVKNLVALDPAFPGSTAIIGYDVDGRTSEKDSPRAFRDVADNSLSFVSQNLTPISGGVAGDSDQAATADNSFVVRFPDWAITNDGHTLVVDAFIDALEHDYLTVPDLTLPYHLDNWYSDNGNKQTGLNSWLPDEVKGVFDLNHHEGRISADAAGEIQEMVRVVDDSGTEESAWT
jgi:peptidoglycan hydrolase-like protein with peptidoglycan-binding domain/predicted alpha/beta hydrolase family esterase